MSVKKLHDGSLLSCRHTCSSIIVVGARQVAGHILFDWCATINIDVINVWNVAGASYTSSEKIGRSTTNGASSCTDGIRGCRMSGGALPGFNVNFDFTAVPAPVAVWFWIAGTGWRGESQESRSLKLSYCLTTSLEIEKRASSGFTRFFV